MKAAYTLTLAALLLAAHTTKQSIAENTEPATDAPTKLSATVCPKISADEVARNDCHDVEIARFPSMKACAQGTHTAIKTWLEHAELSNWVAGQHCGPVAKAAAEREAKATDPKRRTDMLPTTLCELPAPAAMNSYRGPSMTLGNANGCPDLGVPSAAANYTFHHIMFIAPIYRKA
jgi:hypothetical protein